METTSELLDDVERRVEELRDMARKLIEEQVRKRSFINDVMHVWKLTDPLYPYHPSLYVQ